MLKVFKLNVSPKPKIPKSGQTKSLNWNFSATRLLYILIKDWETALNLWIKPKSLRLDETGTSYDQKLICSWNPGQSIGNKYKNFNRHRFVTQIHI